MDDRYKSSKKKMKKYYPFFPNNLLDFLYFNDNKKLKIWFVRIMTSFWLILLSFIAIKTIGYYWF
jgi:hypothetical protein